ncbi:hypothetical protein HMPREF3227_01728 [Corynebacterium sp. CMW7794]|nr:hypothetical protein HMPREF3227_01728 [Corynebacterium sp. CMW7794]
MLGLIPAHAGSTAIVDIPPGIMRAHPRSRGEHGVHNSYPKGGKGSSPLTRGAP